MVKQKKIVEVNKISKSFGHFNALKNVSFDLHTEDIVALVGANGAGKTTLTEIIAGIQKPNKGKIKYNFKYLKNPREKIGMQFQQSDYPSGLSVKDMVTFALRLRNIKMSKKELWEKLNLFQISGFYNKKARTLSGGQKQRLNILMALIHNPHLLILDEVSTGLDMHAREKILLFLKTMLKNKTTTTILISHNADEIKMLCNRIIIINNGEITFDDSYQTFIKKHKSLEKYTKQAFRIKIDQKEKKEK